ncbi:efflux RND transporter periplasmic adaptor subunit [Parendozoicomonas sp. Alg238-R29]|uniref:efflux RND transporter periplasmic adaptor subunit n=1 Tax=Parendozoicomonas sp. Alg238-R29 TaxID=2993446 RepID=UPI00248EE015|nr:efflux RND transporter periplasmic adaptor subunit [Parendozoicomonas sp. Alg238-R29]
MSVCSLDTNATTISELQDLRHFSGTAETFWPIYLEKLGLFFQSSKMLLLVSQGDNWLSLLNHPESASFHSEFLRDVSYAASSAKGSTSGLYIHDASEGRLLVGVIPLDDDSKSIAVAMLLEEHQNTPSSNLAVNFQLLSDIPQSFFRYSSVKQDGLNNKAAFEVLELLATLQNCAGFDQTVLTLCNDLNHYHGYSNVSLGWIERGYIRLQAISQREKLERKMEYCQQIENAMEEALDFNTEIHYTDSAQSYPRHRDLARQHTPAAIASIPLRDQDSIVGILTLERIDAPFDEQEMLKLRVLGDQLGKALHIAKHEDYSFFQKITSTGQEKLSALFGVEHTLFKATAAICTLFFLYMAIGNWSYRVEAPFVVRAENTLFLTAPFDGYIEKSHAKAGDRVDTGQTIVQLSTEDLLLQEANLIADLNRTRRETEKYRAKNELADMRISQTRYQQSLIRLQQVREHLAKADIKAAAHSVVVEGDISRMLGAPVKKGDVLLKLSPLDKIFVELKLDERHIHEVKSGMQGELSFQSIPDQTFAFEIVQVSPAATVNSDGNQFLLKARFTDEKQKWWHPGMTGIAKIAVGERNILWILTHRTTDYLRLLLWI